jgi:hypothetical protein
MRGFHLIYECMGRVDLKRVVQKISCLVCSWHGNQFQSQALQGRGTTPLAYLPHWQWSVETVTGSERRGLDRA